MSNYSLEEESYLKHVVFDDKVIYDIGANTGELSNFFLDNSVNSKIHVVEPHPDNFKILKDKFESFENVFCHEVAVNNYDGICNIGKEEQEKKDGLKQAHVTEDNIDLQKREWEKNESDVICKKLETLCIDADIIKMDIEGFEHNIIKNSIDKLISVDTWLLEIHSWEDIDLHGWTLSEYKLENDSLNKMINLFINNGFNMFIPTKKKQFENNNFDIKNLKWEDIHWGNLKRYNYQKDGITVYYKVLNIIIKKNYNNHKKELLQIIKDLKKE